MGVFTYESRITNHESPITNHQSRITSHQSPITVFVMKNPPLLNRFKHAACGLVAAFRQESNFRIQLALGVVAIAATLALNPPLIWTALVVIMIGAVLAAELLNTALEHALDAAHPETSP